MIMDALTYLETFHFELSLSKDLSKRGEGRKFTESQFD